MSSPIVEHIPAYIRALQPYVPGKPIEETRREYRVKRVVKLASNENPLGPSPRAIVAMRKALAASHLYPDATGYALKQALVKFSSGHSDQAAGRYSAANFILGNGSNEIIDFAVRTFTLPGDVMVTSKGAFVAYRICAQIHGLRTVETPMTADYRYDLTAMLGEIKREARCRLVFIANPNNPTGTWVDDDELRAFLREVARVRGGSVLVVLDYAYWEYVTAPRRRTSPGSAISDPDALLAEFPNVLVLRTFSKIYGIAGARVGYGVARPELIAGMDRVRMPFNVSAVALAGAEAALNDQAFVARARKANQQGLKFWKTALEKLSIPFWPSQGNFLLVDAHAGTGMTGGELAERCLQKGVILRPVSNYGLLHALRISMGTPAENAYALKALKEILR